MTLPSWDRALLDRERALPGLEALLDPRSMFELLNARLPVALRRPLLRYVRYKPGMNCLAAYRLQVDDAPIDLYAKAHRPADAAKLHKGLEKTVPGPLGLPGLVVEELGITVSFFPNDRKVRSLRRLGVADTRRQILRRLLPGEPDWWDGALLPLAYKPERRFVGELRVAGAARAVVKVHSPSDYARRSPWQPAETESGLRLARTLRHAKRHGLVVSEWLPGEQLRELLADPRFDVERVAGVGAALAALHRMPAERLPDPDGEPRLRRLDAVVDFLAALDGDLGRRAEPLAEQLKESLARFEGTATTHGDFYAKQVLLDGDAVSFIDLDAARVAHPMSDLGNFLAHVERDGVSSRIPAASVEGCGAALLAGYRAGGGHVEPRPLTLFTADSMLRVAPHFFRSREPEWPLRTARLLARAASLLGQARGGPSMRVGRPPAPAHQDETGGQPTPLERALRALELPTGLDLRRDSVQRIDVVGRQMILTVETGSGRRWFRLAGERLCELTPADDPAVPLARHRNGGSRLLSYRPLRRIVIASDTGNGTVVEKGYRAGRAAAMAELHAIAERSAGERGFRIPRLLGRRPETESLLFLRLSGHRPRVSRRTAADFGAVGAALRRLQDAAAPTELPLFTAPQELAVLDRWAARVAALGAPEPAGWRSVRAALDEWACRLPGPRYGVAHRDLHDGQILLSDGAVGLLDFDLLCRADPALDPANLLAHFDLRELQRRGEADEGAAGACAHAFLEGLEPEGSAAFRTRLRFYRATALLRLALVYTLRPRWLPLGPVLTARAAEQLEASPLPCRA